MKHLAEGCCVVEPEEGDWRIEGTRRYRVPISSRMGAQHIAQIVSRFGRGCSKGWVNPGSEEVHYVVAGEGQCYIDGFSYPLVPGAAVFVPQGAEFAVENGGGADLTLVSVACPEEAKRRLSEPARTVPLTSYQAPSRVVLERERREIATPQRSFRLLADKDVGCQQVTQFIGYIPPSKAPHHNHPYEEAIYILEGEGTLSAGGDHAPLRAGASIYLAPRVDHCLENSSRGPFRLLGVIYPAGSPTC